MLSSSPRILICSSVGEGKAYSLPLLDAVLPVLCQSIAADFVVYDDTVGGIDEKYHPIKAKLILAGEDVPARLQAVREQLRRYAVNNHYDIVYWHDADMVPQKHILREFVELAHEFKFSNINGLYFMRGVNVPAPAGAIASNQRLVKDIYHYTVYGMGACLMSAKAITLPFNQKLLNPPYYGEDCAWYLDSYVMGFGDALVDTAEPVWHCNGDGKANLPVVGNVMRSLTWEGNPSEVRNDYGAWIYGQPKFGLPDTAFEELSSDFIRREYPELRVRMGTHTEALSDYGYI